MMTIYNQFKQLLTTQERRQMIFLVFIVFIGMVLEVLGISLIFPAIAVMTQPDLVHHYPKLRPLFAFLGNPSESQFIVLGMLALFCFYFFKTLFLIYMVWQQNQFIMQVQRDLSLRLFEGYFRKPWTFHLQRNSAELISNITDEIHLFTSSALQSVLILLTEGLVFLGVMVLLLILKPMATLLVVSGLGIVAWVSQRVVRQRLSRWGVERQAHAVQSMQHLHQGLGGMKEVKLLGRERAFITSFCLHYTKTIAMSQRHKTLMEMPRLWLEFLAVSGLVIAVLLNLFQGQSLTSIVPALGLFAAAAFRLLPSLNRLLGAVQSFRYGFPALDKLSREIQLLDTTAAVLPDSQVVSLPFQYTLSMDSIVYQYADVDKRALVDLTLHIPQGASIGIIGASGSGKSTLVDVILGLLTPSSGCISVDGVDIQTNLRGWQNQIGYVPQTIYLTDDSLRCNVAFGLSEELIDDAAVHRAIQAAQLDEFVKSLPEGVNTFVGERGIRLSGGQRQRIGIARALYHDPALLVLDEATSALDGATEASVMDAINALHGNKTLIIVAHRLSTVSNCDRLYRIEQGRVIEEGSFESVTKTSVVLQNKTTTTE